MEFWDKQAFTEGFIIRYCCIGRDGVLLWERMEILTVIMRKFTSGFIGDPE